MGKSVLVVDDSELVRSLVRRAFADSEFDVLEAVDGVDGLRLLDATADAVAVICDVNMPRMNGLEMVSTVKRQAKYASLPIVMLTTEMRPDFVDVVRKIGAKGWVTKPFRADALVTAVRAMASKA